MSLPYRLAYALLGAAVLLAIANELGRCAA